VSAGAPTVLVTGAGGLIGSAVVRHLGRTGRRVRALVGPPGTPAPELDGIETSFAEITDGDTVEALCAGAEAVVHLAGPPSVAGSFRDPVATVRSHVVGTAVVADACRRTGVRRLVYVSSAEVYGQVTAHRVSEEAPTRPRSPYGAAKLGAESIVRAMAAADPLEVVVLRPFSVYGVDSPAHSLVGTVLRAATRLPAVELQRLDNVRDFVHVDDVARASLDALTVEASGAPVFNIGTGVGTSAGELAELALAAAGRRVPVRSSGGEGRPSGTDLDRLVASTERARRGLGFSAVVSVAEGIAAAVREVGQASAAASTAAPRPSSAASSPSGPSDRIASQS
jgi:nucleoside-diphosphate-sugar epimerase